MVKERAELDREALSGVEAAIDGGGLGDCCPYGMGVRLSTRSELVAPESEIEG